MTSGFLGIALHFIRSTFRHQKEKPVRRAPAAASPGRVKDSSQVSFTREDRCGYAHYEGPEGKLKLYWEFGGGDVIQIISAPTPEEWTAQTNIPLADRIPILSFIGSEAIRQGNGGRGWFEVGENSILIRS